jgi:hypothetical protein
MYPEVKYCFAERNGRLQPEMSLRCLFRHPEQGWRRDVVMVSERYQTRLAQEQFRSDFSPPQKPTWESKLAPMCPWSNNGDT